MSKTSVKKESTALYVLRLTFTLLLITSVVAVALAGINQVTAPIIAASNEAKTQAAVNDVLTGGGTEIYRATSKDDVIQIVYESETGYAIKVVSGGFGGAIEMMVGVSKDGEVLGISIIKHAETPSLGAVAADKGSAGQSFRDSFIGLSGEIAVSKDGGEADTISGATITSRAVADGVNAALNWVKNQG